MFVSARTYRGSFQQTCQLQLAVFGDDVSRPALLARIETDLEFQFGAHNALQSDLLAHPIRFERVTFAFGGQRSSHAASREIVFSQSQSGSETPWATSVTFGCSGQRSCWKQPAFFSLTGRGQRQYSSFSPNFHHGDRPILNVATLASVEWWPRRQPPRHGRACWSRRTH